MIWILLLILSIPSPASPLRRQTTEIQPVRQDRQEAILDSVRADLTGGRSWRALLRLKEAFPEGPGEDETLILLQARAEAGWRNWEGVRRLLEGILEEGTLDRPEAWYLLGRALEGEGAWEEAEAAFTRVLNGEGSEGFEASTESRARRALARSRLARFAEALADVEEIAVDDSSVAGWVALEVAERAASEGKKDATLRALSLVSSDEVRRLGWRFPPGALLVAGDSTGAEAAYWSALPSLSSATDRAEAWERVGVLRVARGDSVGARGAFHQVLSLSPGGEVGLRGAEALMALGFDSLDVALEGARTLARAGRHEEALEAYDAYEELLSAPSPPSVSLARARSHWRAGEGDRALALASELASSEDPAVGAPALALQAQILRRRGRGGQAGKVEDDLVARFPDREEAVEVLYSRAVSAQTRGDMAGAMEGYQRTVELAPSRNLAGQARMRLGQLFLAQGREEEAQRVYAGYLEDFPDGRRWEEAAFWAGRLLLEGGRREEARELFHRIRQGSPLSYYSFRAGEIVGEAFDPPIPFPTDTLPFPAFLRTGLERIDRLLAVSLPRSAAWEGEALAQRFREAMDPERRRGGLLRLAHELNSRGFTREGINLGWEVRRDGRSWDRDILMAVYPFPYRDIVSDMAAERGLDPYLVAGLIRQESAFWAEARSRADARGLMQVLPATGRGLARSAGPEGFDPDLHLFVPEINIHLGTAFLGSMLRRFGEELPIVLSAYNAGPTRAQRWQRYPEAVDMPRFVERIPFTETRTYVKNVLANRGIYTWLYGARAHAAGTPSLPRPGLRTSPPNS